MTVKKNVMKLLFYLVDKFLTVGFTEGKNEGLAGRLYNVGGDFVMRKKVHGFYGHQFFFVNARKLIGRKYFKKFFEGYIF